VELVNTMKCFFVGLSLTAALFACASCTAPPRDNLGLAGLAQLGEVDERFQAYNVEMVEVTGGRFWAPYNGPAGEVYRQRPPIDLADAKLRHLARHLAPSFMRVSGTWANNTYVEAIGENLSAPPAGFQQRLTRAQWQSVVEFAKAVDAPIVTSFAVSSGTRDSRGNWQPAQAQRLLDLTREAGGELLAAEFFNEPNVPGAAAEMPKDYDAKRYGADFRAFHTWARQAMPGVLILGPGGVGEGSLLRNIPVNVLGGKPVRSEDMLAANPGGVDALSYHFYGSVSQRCEALKMGTAQKQDALKPAWLDLTVADYTFYADLRDRLAPGKPMWNTETAQAACGGSPWASTFLDSFRYLNQLGILAQRDVKVVMHNTLAASDYALIDRDTLAARPNYYAAVLWRRLMGRKVLASPASTTPELRLYAHCLRGQPGGVAVLAMNIGETPREVDVGHPSSTWLMTGDTPEMVSMLVNGHSPRLNADGALHGLDSTEPQSRLTMPPRSIAFIAVAGVNNPACH
jgi:heparanase